jgi:hypothetical protein
VGRVVSSACSSVPAIFSHADYHPLVERRQGICRTPSLPQTKVCPQVVVAYACLCVRDPVRELYRGCGGRLSFVPNELGGFGSQRDHEKVTQPKHPNYNSATLCHLSGLPNSRIRHKPARPCASALPAKRCHFQCFDSTVHQCTSHATETALRAATCFHGAVARNGKGKRKLGPPCGTACACRARCKAV